MQHWERESESEKYEGVIKHLYAQKFGFLMSLDGLEVIKS